jgi:hypothetical protein
MGLPPVYQINDHSVSICQISLVSLNRGEAQNNRGGQVPDQRLDAIRIQPLID